MHVGSDVLEALTEADKQGKSQTHIATSRFNDGDRVTISAALSGRFWSMATAPNLKAWKDWCDQQGAKLLDDTIDLKEIFAGFIIPQELSQRPPHVLLAAEWPWEFYTGTGTYHSITVDEKPYPLTDVEFVIDNYDTIGPFLCSLTTPAWRIAYQADFGDTGLIYSPVDDDGDVTNRRETAPLQEWINTHKPYLFLAGDRLILPDDRLLEPQYERDPFDRGRFTTFDWAGVDITVESQGTTRRADSIQAYMSAYLQEWNEFDILLDDDRKGEAADLVGLQVDGTELHITLVHCKYSSDPSVGARLKDLYDVCRQVIRGVKAKRYHALTGNPRTLAVDFGTSNTVAVLAAHGRAAWGRRGRRIGRDAIGGLRRRQWGLDREAGRPSDVHGWIPPGSTRIPSAGSTTARCCGVIEWCS
jgi:hypothetical protein